MKQQLKKNQPKWNKDVMNAKNKIKEKVKQLPPLSLLQGSHQMVIEIDASNKAWRGILIENMEIRRKSAATPQEH